MKTAIIVPGVTDMNKGDQALVWESHRLAVDTGCFDEVFLLETGDTSEEIDKLCHQSKGKGFHFITNILKHPRRGKHNVLDAVIESQTSNFKLIFRSIRDFINRSFLLLICKNEKAVSLFYNDSVSKSVKQFRDCDTIFVKGGGFIHAYGESSAPYLIWFFLFYVRLGLALGKTVIFLPNSYGPFEGLTVKWQIKNVFDRLSTVYAREKMSAQMLRELIYRPIPVSLDLGFYLKLRDSEIIDVIFKNYHLTKGDKIVGITIRPWRFPGHANPEDLFKNYIYSVQKLVEKLIEKNYKVALCNQSIGPNAHEDDRNAIKELIRTFDSPNLVWINEDLPCDVLKALYSNFYAFIGTRFHSVIFSLTSLVPSIAIAYGGNKAIGIMADLEMKKFSVNIEKVTDSILISLFDDLEKNYQEIKEQLSLKLNEIHLKRLNIIDNLRNVIIDGRN